MSDQDWDEKLSKEIWDDIVQKISANHGRDTPLFQKLICEGFAIKLREARKIEWPSEAEVQHQEALHFAYSEETGPYSGFQAGVEWLKAYVEGRRK